MDTNQNNPKVFISYSWSSSEHEKWVMGLYDRLRSNGVDAIIDKVDLKTGHDAYKFMEEMVTDPDIKNVLIICDKKYQEKADNRQGGVGTEAQIMTPEIYNKAKQEKFIPIVKERGNDGTDYLPAYLKTRIYIDFSSEIGYEESYEELLRTIYGKPTHVKPKLGEMPSYLNDDSGLSGKNNLHYFAKQIENAFMNNNSYKAKTLLDGFLAKFTDSLEEYKLPDPLPYGQEGYDLFLKNLQDMIPLRNDFIDVTKVVFRNNENTDSYRDKYHSFLEGLLKYQRSDNYKFFITELMLYFIAILFKYEKYKEAESFITRDYYKNEKRSGIEVFRSDCPFIDKPIDYSNGPVCMGIKPSAKLILGDSRVNRQDINVDDLRQADYMLNILTFLKTEYPWYPILNAYNRDELKIPVLSKMVSSSHFNKVKSLFEVSSSDEFKDKINKLISKDIYKKFVSDYRVIAINQILDLNKIASDEEKLFCGEFGWVDR